MDQALKGNRVRQATLIALEAYLRLTIPDECSICAPDLVFWFPDFTVVFDDPENKGTRIFRRDGTKEFIKDTFFD